MARNRSISETTACPLTRIVGANENGIIAISRDELEINSTFALGLHVSLPDSRQSEFVSAETMIVACQPELDHDGTLVFRVALLFSDISWRDRDLLELMAYDEGIIAPSGERNVQSRDISGHERLREAIGKLGLN